jgi:ABC-2 type transport system ATP-binding protein
LLLDEPTVGLDPDVALRIREYILAYHRKTHNTLVLTTHYMPEAQALCEEIAFIKEGRILAQGTSAELQTLAQASDLEKTFLEFAK